MIQEPLALLLSNGNHWHRELEQFLRWHQISFGNARSLGQLSDVLGRTYPEVIITAAHLHDGTWRDVVDLTEKAPVPASIIVVVESNHSRPYLAAAIDYGVFDFIYPPFASEIQASIIQMAARDARRKREGQVVQSLATLM